jgi:hypothetical protein
MKRITFRMPPSGAEDQTGDLTEKYTSAGFINFLYSFFLGLFWFLLMLTGSVGQIIPVVWIGSFIDGHREHSRKKRISGSI